MELTNKSTRVVAHLPKPDFKPLEALGWVYQKTTPGRNSGQQIHHFTREGSPAPIETEQTVWALADRSGSDFDIWDLDDTQMQVSQLPKLSVEEQARWDQRYEDDMRIDAEDRY